ncbi:MAG: hypothetical protein IKD43_02545 [Clostridia bacterium]|nr:hypothetical protein [Clostridia bacterium]
MQNYKEVCGDKECVWFEIEPSEGKKFLKWAKVLGCVWLSGEEINPEKGADFCHFSIHNDGKLANIAMSVWFAKHPKFENIDRYVFNEYIKDKKISPQSYMVVSPLQ